MSNDTPGTERVLATTSRTIFGGVGFNQFNGEGFDGSEVFQAMRGAFEHATKQFPETVHESDYLFGGHHVRIRIVGSQLAQHIVQPFSHLRIPTTGSNSPQLTIDLWDENATDIRCYTGARGTHDHKWPDVTSISSDSRFVGQLQPHTLSCFDRNAQHIMGSIAWSDRIFIYERAKPLSRLLLEWHNDQNIQVIHAGLVSRHGQGVLFVAKSGSGKSTASLACLCAGFHYLGEDFIGLQRAGDGSFNGHSLYNSAFLETGHSERFPEFTPYVIKGQPHEVKSVVILSHVFPERLEQVAPIRAVVVPRVVNTPNSRFRPASKGQALLTFGPSSLIEIPSRGMESFARLAQLVEQVPTYWLELGRDLESIPECIEELLAKSD